MNRVHLTTERDALNEYVASAIPLAKLSKGEETEPELTTDPAQAVEEKSTPSGSGDDDEQSEEPETSESTDSRGYELPLDQIFEILKNSRRRETLHYLDANDGDATLSDLAEHIAALENDTTVKAISSSQRKRVYVGLYQCHLPKMDDMAIVDFDQNRGTIELGPNADQLKPYLDEPEQEGWHKIYGSVTIAGAVLFGIGQAGGAQYGLTPSLVLLAVLVAIAACALVQFGALEQ